ncbi:hypothetical protein [Geodermatophilus sp. SYSU D01119]
MSAVLGPGDAQEQADGIPAPTTTVTELPQPSPEVTPEPPGFSDGTYLVGTDVQPGLYRSTGAAGCYWERLDDVTGDFDAILANDNPSGQTYVEILPTDVAFMTEDCGRWMPTTAGGPDVSGGFGDGTYLIGSDIQPGTYSSTGSSDCYWERLDGLTGDFGAILANDNPQGQTYVQILPTDVAFSTDDCGTWHRVG